MLWKLGQDPKDHSPCQLTGMKPLPTSEVPERANMNTAALSMSSSNIAKAVKAVSNVQGRGREVKTDCDSD